MALSLTMASAMASVQRIPDRSIRSLIRFLHAPSTGPLAMGPTLCLVVVVAHAMAVAVKVVDHAGQRFCLGTRQFEFGHTLTQTLDHTANLTRGGFSKYADEPTVPPPGGPQHETRRRPFQSLSKT